MEKRAGIIVTGCAGMLGSALCDWLIENKPEYTVLGIDNLAGGYMENVNANVVFYLRDAGSDLKDIFEEYDVKYFYSFHSYSAEGFSPFVRKFTYTNNLVSIANIVNHCIAYKCKLIFASSMSVYGNGKVPFKETDVCIPYDPYANSKLACERDIEIAHDQHGLEYAIIRLHNVVGERQNMWDKYRNVASIFIKQLLDDVPLTIYGDGTQRRAFSHVNDYLPIFWKVAEETFVHPTFNCGGDKYYTINELASILLDVVGKPNHPITHLQPRHEVKDAWCDHSKVKNVLGFVDKTDLRQILMEMWEWARVQPKREVKKWENIELEVGLYDYWK